jgi:imidazolonepropionase-like amidohydrolase
MLAIRAARRFNGESATVVPDPVVLVDGGRIAAVQGDRAVPAAVELIDLGKVTLLPGHRRQLLPCCPVRAGRAEGSRRRSTIADVVAAGFDADILAVAGDPLDNPAALRDVRAGRLVRKGERNAD